MNKSFKHRLDALEALEAAAERERQQQASTDIPDLDVMDEATLTWAATLGLRNYCMRLELSAPLGPVQIVAQPMRTAVWQRFYDDLAIRMQPLIDSCPKPLMLIAAWEVADAIDLIDAGRVDTVPLWPAAAVPDGGSHWSLRVDANTGSDEVAIDTIKAVNWTYDLYSRQCYHPQPRNFRSEFTTLDQWRAWLAGMLVPAEQEER
jgi:hypothetical protein